MYLGFYGLEREPFHITPDPDFLYLSPSHKEAFATIVYGVEQRKGFVALTGEVGTGKTTVLRAYLKRVDDSKIRAIYLFNPSLTFHDLLRILLRELNVENAEASHEPTMLEQLQWALLKEYEDGRNVALIVDEAQNMPVETLENMRMLSNLETVREKLLQIVLVGQPELETTLARHELRQLRQRIAVQAHIRALSPEESQAYIAHRLMQAGCIREKVFTQGALKALVRHCGGTPRALNIACDNALIAGYGGQEETVSLKTVKEVIRDLRRRNTARQWNKGVLAGAAGLAAVLAIGLAVWGGGNLAASDGDRATPVYGAETAPEPAPAAESAAVALADAEDEEAEAPRRSIEVRTQVARVPVQDTRKIALERLTEQTRQAEAALEVEAPEAAAPNEEVAAPADEPVEEPVQTASLEASETPSDLPEKQEEPEKAGGESPEVKAEDPVEAAVSPTQDPDTAVTFAAVNGSDVLEGDGDVVYSFTDDGTQIRKDVRKGDQLLRILVDVYGFHHPDLIAEVLSLNPHIEDMNIIRAGDVLVLPAPERLEEGRDVARPDSDRNPS